MPLREGSSDKVVQENIKCILDKDGCGYDPPYKDPGREEYTPAQAAAIAYAKAGRRNNTGKKTSASKKTKSVKTQELKTPEAKKEEPKSPAQSAKPETETDTKQPGSDIQVPDGWKVQQPGGDTTSKKNQPPKKEEEELSPEADKQMLDEVMEGYKLKWGNSASLLSDAWDTYNPKQKKKFLQHAKKIKAEELAKEKKENKSSTPAPAAPAPAPSAQSAPQSAPAPSKGDAGADESEKMLQDLLNSPDVNDISKYAIKNQWKNITPEEQKALHDEVIKGIKPAPKPQAPAPAPAPQPQTPAGWKQKDDGWTAHIKPKFDDSGNITYQGKVYKPTKTLPGSTQPKLYTDEQGAPKFVVKEGGAEGQNDAEFTANQVYGILAPHLPTSAIKSRLIDGKLVNDFMPNSKTINDLSDDELDNYDVASKVRGSLAADALVANWDYAGLANDNMMVDKQGNILRIDSGGTFNYRAQGGPKDFDSAPMEMWTLRSSAQGKQFWDNAQEEDYENLWREQVAYVRMEGDKLKNTVLKSNLDSQVKDAFVNRVNILSIAAEEVDNIAKREGVSWKEVDQVMERAFRLSLQMNPQSTDWADKVRNKIRNDLNKAFPENPSEFNLKGGVLDDYDYKQKVDLATRRLNDREDGWEAFNGASGDEKYSVYSYTGGGYKDLNKYLRAGIGGDNPAYKEYYETKAKHLQTLLKKLPSDQSLLHRMNSVSSDANINFYKNLKPGDVVETDGFDSYTRDDTGSIMEIFAQGSPGSRLHFITQYQGKNAKDVDPISATPGEQESVMERGTRLKVAQVQIVPVSNFPELDPSSVGGSKILMITYEDV